MALSKTTQDHDEIRQWAEKRGGKPAEVASTETKNDTGIIRIEFPGATNANDSNLKEISWDEFFEKFDKSGLALVYQEVTKEGAESNFNKLVKPENASGSAKKTAAKKTAAKGAAKKTVSKTPAKKTASTSSAKTASASKTSAKKASASKTPAKTAAAKKAPAKAAGKTASPASKAASKSAAKTATAKKATKSAAAKGR